MMPMPPLSFSPVAQSGTAPIYGGSTTTTPYINIGAMSVNRPNVGLYLVAAFVVYLVVKK
jgi:hypothetical protein